ncbi:hypothetical protein A2U01_0059316, partial [Trifolium medium]|nr:hypothetical protein [Trifolium medium]
MGRVEQAQYDRLPGLALRSWGERLFAPILVESFRDER